MAYSAFPDETVIINNGREQLVTARDGERRIYVAVNHDGYTDYPLPIRDTRNGTVIVWDRPEAFTQRFRNNVHSWMSSNPNPNDLVDAKLSADSPTQPRI